MTGLEDAALLAVVAIGSAFSASALVQASWPRRSPAAAILLWQALGLASGVQWMANWTIAVTFPALRHALADGRVRKTFDEGGMDVFAADQQTPEAAGALLKRELKLWGEVIRANNIAAQ